MIIFYWVIGFILVYFFIVFVVLRLVVPFMGFRQHNLPVDLPLDVKQTILKLENESTDQLSYLEAVYGFIVDKNEKQWKHTRFKAGRRLDRLFVKDLNYIWITRDFIYCQAMNFVILVMLVNSKFFKANDVKTKTVFLNFVPHQYVQVKVGDKWVDVDPAGAGIRGLGLGHHASLLG